MDGATSVEKSNNHWHNFLDGMILSKDSKSHHCIKQETAVIRLQEALKVGT